MFRLAALILVPIALLGILELGLRIAGVGHSTSFFVARQIQGEECLVENPFFGLSFFPRALLRSSSPVVMRVKKRPGTYRVFLFGESAALGDPRPAYGVGRYLQTLLQEHFPDKEVEVVCVAMTAINSHAIVPIARECARYNGDLWVVYMGNNEMLGPFGASTVFGQSTPSTGVVRFYLALQRTRIGQGFVELMQKLRSGKTRATWGGMKMFQDQQVPATDPRREQVYRNFQANLTSIVQAGVAARVPIILSSVASNLKDCPPFMSLPPQSLGSAESERWNALFREGATNQARQQFREALENYRQVARMASQQPELQFRMGECFQKTGNQEEARRCLVLARDLDALPFRADSRINGIIAETARRNADVPVYFLDAEHALSTSVSVSIPGEESFYEHVHLNFVGNYRLARAMADLVVRQLPSAQASTAKLDWADETACAQVLGLTDWNRLPVLEEMRSRLQDPPFSNQVGHEQRLERLEQQITETETRLRASPPDAGRQLYEQAIQRHTKDHWLHHNYAEYLSRAGDLANAVREMQIVCELVPQHYTGYFHTGRLLARSRKYDEAIRYLQAALKLRPEFPDIYLELGRALANSGDKEGALKYCRLAGENRADDGRAQLLAAKVLESLKRRAEAVQSLRGALRIDPGLWEAHDLLGTELSLDEKFPEAQAEFEQVVRLRPNYGEGHLNLGIALGRQRRWAEALAEIQEALRLEPQNPRAQEFRSAIEQMQKQAQ